MDLRESPETQAFRAEVAEFVAARLPPDIRAKVLGFLRIERDDYVRWQRILNERGWGAPGWPREHGGTGWDARQRTVFEEECFLAGAPRQMPFGLSMVGPVLQAFGSPQQQKRFLPRILTMEDWWCQGYSEPGAGSDLASLTTRAERRDDIYIVSGQKTWTSFAHWANWIFCLVRTRTAGKPQEGISFLLIDMTTPGVRVKPIRTLDEVRTSTRCFWMTWPFRWPISSGKRTGVGPLPSSCSATSERRSQESACASGSWHGSKDVAGVSRSAAGRSSRIQVP